MKIEKLVDGSTRVLFENGQTFYVQKGVNPIDGMIDIGLMQQKTAQILKKPASADSYVLPITFFYALSRKCIKEISEKSKDLDWHAYAAKEFNLEISNQERMRTVKENISISQSDEQDNDENENDCGKYKICYQDALPEFITRTPKSRYKSDLTLGRETTDYRVAYNLLRLIHAKLDIREIEDRISELMGLCAYLKMIAPDEFNAYLVVVDNLGFNTELDINGYYEILNRIIKE